MAIDFFLVKNPLAGKKGLIAQTVHGPTMTLAGMVERMAAANAGLSGPEIKGVLSLLEETVMTALLEGRSVEIGEMLKLTPVVTGVFAGDDLRKAENKPEVRITCRVLPEYLRRFQNRARPEKRRAADVKPLIVSLAGGEGEAGILHAYYPNSLEGERLKPRHGELVGLQLVRKERPSDWVSVGKGELSVQRHTAYRFAFHFSSRFVPPGWLTPGAELLVSLEFRRGKAGRPSLTNSLPAVWRAGGGKG